MIKIKHINSQAQRIVWLLDRINKIGVSAGGHLIDELVSGIVFIVETQRLAEKAGEFEVADLIAGQLPMGLLKQMAKEWQEKRMFESYLYHSNKVFFHSVPTNGNIVDEDRDEDDDQEAFGL